MKNKTTWSERINARLQEDEGEIFKRGKWRWWFFLLLGLQSLNAVLTGLIFAGGDWAFTIACIVGGLLGWMVVGTLHYSDSPDGRLARGVSLLDSIALCFVIAHFALCFYVYGHLITLQREEAKYDAASVAFNDRLKNISTDDVEIVKAQERIEQSRVKVAKLENDTAYQNRRAVEASGVRVGRASISRPRGDSPSLSRSQVELERPKSPSERSADFLGKWDALIRVAGFGELILAAITFIYIRNRSARYNASSERKNAPEVNYGAAMAIPATVAGLRQGDAETATPVATVARGHDSTLKALRDHLRIVAFGIPKHWFKVDLIPGGVTIRLCRRKAGREVTVKQTRQSNKILDAVSRPDFRERLIDELMRQGFPVGGER